MAEITTPSFVRRLTAETFGTFLLVFGVVGVAIWYNGEAKPLVVGLAVGIAVLAGVYAVGHVSGGHFNPAVSVGAAAAGRLPWRDVPPYAAAQLVGGLIAALIHWLIVLSTGMPLEKISTVFAGVSNGFDNGHAPLLTVLIVEVVITAIFVLIILGVTAEGSTAAGFAPLAIGLSLALFHFIAIPIDNASLNPARSLATAVFGGVDSLAQVWVFFVAPLIGALIAGFVGKSLFSKK
ncbi:MAG: aquaporin [Pseudolysinimonas sp.]|uniref:aquaporin n=1 Tax=Pseudolysinimonas sp. TaxID=2680009 RepID=UPI0032633CB7